MRRPRIITFVALAIPLILACRTVAAEPRVFGDRYKLELVAADPEIVTPVGLAFDQKGRLLVVESHTHLTEKDYKGLATDRIRMLSDSDGDGKLDKWTTFAEGFRHAMNLFVRDDGGVYLVTRGKLILLRDADNDGIAERRQELLRLDTEDDYPHNALGGIDQAADGSLLLGLGENHGLPFRLASADGKVTAATGGLDGFFLCTADGKNVEHLARGVWNPFSLCVLDDGRIFAVDNDPDASPPCRLLHVVPGGDYGYLYQYGRAGTHPLQCWNGELPGTLPMVCGTGEAPTAIVPHAGGLWVTSWGDHRIERYELVPRGASYGAKRDVIVQGDANFRPTGMAVAPDGSLYFADWVLRDYPVHGRGRIWRLSLPPEELKKEFAPRSKEDLAASNDAGDPVTNAESSDPFVHTHGVWQLAEQPKLSQEALSRPRIMLSILEAERIRNSNSPEKLLRFALNDESADVRLFAVRWIADDRIRALRDEVAKLLDGPQPSPQYYLALLGAIDWLDHEPSHRDAKIADELLVRELQNETRPPAIHALALRLLSPDDKFLTGDRLREYLASDDHQLRLEAVRTVAQQSNPARGMLLAEIAIDENQPEIVRAEAIAGLAPYSDQSPPAMALRGFLQNKNLALRREAERALRLSAAPPPDETKPSASDAAAWAKVLANPGDAESGRRLFFSTVGPRCCVCHKYDGRGGNIGPDLTQIGRSMAPERIISSILQPGQEIAPDYQPWILQTDDGKTYIGLRLPKGGDDGKELYIDSAGNKFTLASSSIEDRQAAPISIMPDNLQSTLTTDDLRDLVTFLASPPEPNEKAPGH